MSDDNPTPFDPLEMDLLPVLEGPPGGKGAKGDQGPQGPTGLGADDPGDLTLLFDNRLI